MAVEHTLQNLDTRLTALLEELPRLATVKELERVWLRRAAEYEGGRDEKQFVALLKEVETLAHALGVGRNGQINTGLAAVTPSAPVVRTIETGPGLPGWGRSPRRRKRVSYNGPRDAAPLQYPWGSEPPVSPPRQSDPLTVARYTGPPFVDPYLARVRAEAEAEAEALRRCGYVQYHGADEPPTYAMRENE